MSLHSLKRNLEDSFDFIDHAPQHPHLTDTDIACMEEQIDAQVQEFFHERRKKGKK